MNPLFIFLGKPIKFLHFGPTVLLLHFRVWACRLGILILLTTPFRVIATFMLFAMNKLGHNVNRMWFNSAKDYLDFSASSPKKIKATLAT